MIEHKNINGLDYWQKGEKPTVLILSGMHGDEFGVIEVVRNYLVANANILPNFLYIPAVSPSAVRLRTRVNERGLDLNRSFKDSIVDHEIDAIKKLLMPHRFQLCLDFHEDLEQVNEFYMYDSAKLPADNLEKLRDNLLITGVELYSGPDDPHDSTLSNHIERGYLSLPFSEHKGESGFFGTWANRAGIIEREVTLEVPGQVAGELKSKLVEVLFGSIML